MNDKYVERKKEEFKEGILRNIDEHLKILNSRIILPRKNGEVQETRLLAVVKSREKVHTNLYKFIDLAGIDRDADDKLKNSIVSGLINSYEELDFLFLRSMRMEDVLTNGEYEDEPVDYEEAVETSDDIISSISDSKVMAGEIMTKILERITLIEDPEKSNREKLEETEVVSITELYARR